MANNPNFINRIGQGVSNTVGAGGKVIGSTVGASVNLGERIGLVENDERLLIDAIGKLNPFGKRKTKDPIKVIEEQTEVIKGNHEENKEDGKQIKGRTEAQIKATERLIEFNKERRAKLNEQSNQLDKGLKNDDNLIDVNKKQLEVLDKGGTQEKQKKVRSEKQIEATRKLVEFNKKRFEEQKKQSKAMDLNVSDDRRKEKRDNKQIQLLEKIANKKGDTKKGGLPLLGGALGASLLPLIPILGTVIVGSITAFLMPKIIKILKDSLPDIIKNGKKIVTDKIKEFFPSSNEIKELGKLKSIELLDPIAPRANKGKFKTEIEKNESTGFVGFLKDLFPKAKKGEFINKEIQSSNRMLDLFNIKKGVEVDGLRKEIKKTFPTIADIYNDVSGERPTITAGTDGTHMKGSLHYKGQAIDLRSKNLKEEQKDLVFAELKKRLGKDYDVLLEDRGMPNEHFHIEYDPKGQEKIVSNMSKSIKQLEKNTPAKAEFENYVMKQNVPSVNNTKDENKDMKEFLGNDFLKSFITALNQVMQDNKPTVINTNNNAMEIAR